METRQDRPTARWEKVRLEGASWPVWRCSACRDVYYTDPRGLECVFYCPKCGAHVGGIVER